MPVQRIPRYELLLQVPPKAVVSDELSAFLSLTLGCAQDFLRGTPEHHDDYEDVRKAQAEMHQVATYIERKKEEAENIYHIMAIQDSLEGKFDVYTQLSTIPWQGWFCSLLTAGICRP